MLDLNGMMKQMAWFGIPTSEQPRRAPTMITCEKAGELLLDFLENTLSPNVHQQLSTHLQGCAPCLRFVESYKKTTSLCKKTLMKEAPSELEGRLIAFLRQETIKPACKSR